MHYFLALTLFAASVSAFSGGAPDAVCSQLVPKHHADPQTSNPPYELVPAGDLKAGQTNKLILRGKGSADEIKGFVVQARVDGKPAGKMIAKGNSQLLDCGGPGNSLTHKKIEDKINKIDFEWEAPADLRGKNVDFTVTVVKQYDTFWVAKSLLKSTL